MRLALMALACAAAAACAETPAADADACGASAMQDLVGADRGALAAMSFVTGMVRVIEPGMAVTQDYSPARVNFDLDGDGRIVRVWCG